MPLTFFDNEIWWGTKRGELLERIGLPDLVSRYVLADLIEGLLEGATIGGLDYQIADWLIGHFEPLKLKGA